MKCCTVTTRIYCLLSCFDLWSSKWNFSTWVGCWKMLENMRRQEICRHFSAKMWYFQNLILEILLLYCSLRSFTKTTKKRNTFWKFFGLNIECQFNHTSIFCCSHSVSYNLILNHIFHISAEKCGFVIKIV